MMPDTKQPPDWIGTIKARGLARSAQTALDIIEPLAPLLAQVLWVTQPLAGLFGAQRPLHEIATLLDQPGGIDTLRTYLQDEAVEPISEKDQPESNSKTHIR